jgi:hypothetical protein
VEDLLVRVLPPLGRTRSPLCQSGSPPALPMGVPVTLRTYSASREEQRAIAEAP